MPGGPRPGFPHAGSAGLGVREPGPASPDAPIPARVKTEIILADEPKCR